MYRHAFSWLLVAARLPVVECSTVKHFWKSYDPERTGCVVLDAGGDQREQAIALADDPRLLHPLIILSTEENLRRRASNLGPGVMVAASFGHSIELVD